MHVGIQTVCSFNDALIADLTVWVALQSHVINVMPAQEHQTTSYSLCVNRPAAQAVSGHTGSHDDA